MPSGQSAEMAMSRDVNMYQAKGMVIELAIQEIVIKLKHSLLCQLIRNNFNLKQPVDCDPHLRAS